MAEEGFDPKRETLVMETKTIWSPECGNVSPEEKDRIAQMLHDDPNHASQLRYTRSHTGFIREITVMPADLERIRTGPAESSLTTAQ